MIEVNIPNLVGGVTQQAESLRFPAQVESQENVIPSIISGSTKRNGTDYKGSLAGAFTPETHFHDINRDDSERYLVAIESGALQVFDAETGVEQTVAFPDGTDYLDVGGASSGDTFKTLTVADTTFIANTTKVVEAGEGSSPDASKAVLLFVKQGGYGVDYSVTLNSGSYDARATADFVWSSVSGDSVVLDMSIEFGGSGYTVLPDVNAQIGGANVPLIIAGVWNPLVQVVGGDVSVDITVSGGNVTTLNVHAHLVRYIAHYGAYPYTTAHPIIISEPDSPPAETAPVTVKYTASTDSTSGGANKISTQYIANDLKVALATSTELTEYEFTQYDNLIEIIRTDGSYFEASASDGSGDTYLGVVQRTVDSLDALPTNCFNDYTVQVIGDALESADDYYLKFATNHGGTFGLGSWVETLGPRLVQSFDPLTMPHLLVSDGTGFTFKKAEWDQRYVGDDDTNPFTEVIGNAVSELSYTQRRLGIFAGDHFIYSETDQPFNMFRTTVTNVLDTQPIELEITDEAVSSVRHVLAHEGNILMFAEKAQYILDLSEGFTFEKITMSQATRTEFSTSCKPVALNADTFFCFPRGDAVGLKQFSVDKNTLKLRTYDISAHVPRYITKDPYLLTAVPSEDMLLIHTTGLTDGCFVYRFVDKNGERVQSSFSRITLGGVVLHSYVIDSLVYFLIKRQGVVHIEQWNPTVAQLSNAEGATFPTLLDHRVSDADTTLSYNGDTDLTTLTLPTDIESGVELAICTRGANAGTVLATIVGDDSASYTVSGDITGQELWIGLTFSSQIELTRPTVMKPTGGGGQVAVTGGDFQVLYGRVTVNDCFPFSVEVAQEYRDPYTYTMKETDLGVLPTTPPEANDGEYRFAVYGRSDKVTITLKNDTPYPSSWLSLAWEGRYTKTNTTL